MKTKTIKLTEQFVNKLSDLPESGMGYQVKVILRNGKILRQHKVINSELLMIDGNEKIYLKDIEKIELEA
ncbi:hypothetical protein MASR2M47_11420 [Draconibacterium sp.]|jgi:hypothetical protein